MQPHDFRRVLRVRIAHRLPVYGVEGLQRLRQGRDADGTRRNRGDALAELAVIAHLHRAGDRHVVIGHPFPAQGDPGRFLHLREQGVDPLQVRPGGLAHVGALVIVLEIGEHHAVGAVDRCHPGHDQLADAELLHDLHGVNGRGAARRAEGEIPRVEAPLGEAHMRAARHVGIDHLVDRRRGLLDREVQRGGDLLPDGLLREILPQPGFAPEEPLRIDVAQHHVGIGHGRLVSALAVAGRTGKRAGALRPDAQASRGIDAGDAAAARADGVHVHAGQGEFLPVDHLLLDRFHHPVVNHAHVEAGAAHVDRQHVVEPVCPAERTAERWPGGRARQQQRGRILDHDLRCRDPSVALHQQQLAPETLVRQQSAHLRDEAGHRRRHVGRKHGGTPAVHLSGDRQHHVGQGHVHPGCLFPDDLPDALLVRGIQVGEQERHGDGLDAFLIQATHCAPHVFLVQRRHHLAPAVDALLDLLHQVERRQGGGRIGTEVVHVRRPLPPFDLRRLGEGHAQSIAPGGDGPHPRARFRRDQVGRQGRPEHDGAGAPEQPRQGLLRFLRELRDAVDDADGGIGRRGVRLAHARAAFFVDQDTVGEGAAAVHRDSV